MMNFKPGIVEKLKRGWKALGKPSEYRNQSELKAISFINLLLMAVCALVIFLVILWVLLHGAKPFGDTRNDEEMTSQLNISYPEKLFKPNIGRSGINCTDFGNLCTPCDVPCDGMVCSDHVCSLACIDNQYSNRTGTFYTSFSNETAKYTTDFSRCHQTWQDHSLTLNPTSTANKTLYTAIGGLAALLNVRLHE